MPFFSTSTGSPGWFPQWSAAGYPPFSDGLALVSTTATGNGARKALFESVGLLEQLAEASPALSAQPEPLRLALAALRQHSMQLIPDLQDIASALAQLRHLTQPHLHEPAARTIFEFASQAPEILRLLQHERRFRY